MGEFVIFFTIKSGWRTRQNNSETLMLHQKCAYEMKVNFFHAVIGEIDDDGDKKTYTQRYSAQTEITNCAAIWAFTLSFYTLKSETTRRMQGSLLFIKSFYWIILLMALGKLDDEWREANFCDRTAISAYGGWLAIRSRSGIHFPNYEYLGPREEGKFFNNKLKIRA